MSTSCFTIDEANIKRSEFNQRLRSAFASDLISIYRALNRSGPMGAARSSNTAGGITRRSKPRYAEDEAHLNPLGQQVPGTAFLRFVAGARRRD